MGEYEYLVLTDRYSKLSPSVDKYESSEEVIEGEITQDTTVQVMYYLICNDDTTLVFKGLNSNGSITTNESEIVSYMIGDGTANYGNGLKSNASGIKYILNIPNEYNGKPVTSIGGQFTFARTAVQKITLENNLNSISRYSFAWCTDLKSVLIKRNKGISLGDNTFEGCTKLDDVTLFVENIGGLYTAFSGCTSLERVKVNDDNESLMSDEEGIVYSKDKTKLIFYPPGKKENYVFPDTVTAIGYGAFGGQMYITDIEIPERITNIDIFTFWGSNLKKVICRGNSISREMFRHCGNLEEIVIGKNVTSIGRLIFYGDNKLKKITYEGTMQEWNSISKNGDWKIGMPNGLVVNCTDGTIEL